MLLSALAYKVWCQLRGIVLASNGLFWVQKQTAAGLLSRHQVESAMGPTTFYKILTMPKWSLFLAELGHLCLFLHQDTTQPLSTRPTLLMASCLFKCPYPMLQLRRAFRFMDV